MGFTDEDGRGNESMISCAALAFRPTMMMLALPWVWEASDWAIAWPIPAVPPKKTAVGAVKEENIEALDARILAMDMVAAMD